MNTLEALTAGSTLDIDKNIDKIIAILSTCKTSLEPQEVSTEKREGEEIAHPTEKAAKIDNVCALPRLAHEKWAQIFSVASRRRKITDTSECLSVIIDNLYGVPEVSSVDLSGLMWVTDNVIKMIGSALERAKLFDSVTFVNVDMCEKISFECLYDSILSKAPNTTQLSCKFCTQFSCAQLGKLYVRPSLLTSVDFSGLHTVSDSFLTDFFLVFPSVRVLKLDYVSGLAANVLKIVSEKLPSLTHLSLSFSEPQVVIE